MNRTRKSVLLGAAIFLAPTLAFAAEPTTGPIKPTFFQRLFHLADAKTAMMDAQSGMTENSMDETSVVYTSPSHGIPSVQYRTLYKVPGVVAETMPSHAQFRTPISAGYKGGPR